MRRTLNGHLAFLALTIALPVALAGCGSREDAGGGETAGRVVPAAAVESAADTAPRVEESMPAPSWAEAANTAYRLWDETVELSDGAWEGRPYVEGGASAPRVGLVPGFWLSGDLDGDRAYEAVVLLWSSSGGSGTFDFLAVLDRNIDGSAVNRATAALGDRVKLRSAMVVDGTVVLETIEAGPDDAACCPGQKKRRSFALEGEAMTETGSDDQGRLSVADIAGDWVLTHLGRDEAVPDGIEVSLTVGGGAIAGKSACNRYTGTVSEGDSPGDLRLAAPLASTRMMCPEAIMDWENRYLHALQNLNGFTFQATRLMLTWADGESMGSLHFERSGD